MIFEPIEKEAKVTKLRDLDLGSMFKLVLDGYFFLVLDDNGYMSASDGKILVLNINTNSIGELATDTPVIPVEYDLKIMVKL